MPKVEETARDRDKSRRTLMNDILRRTNQGYPMNIGKKDCSWVMITDKKDTPEVQLGNEYALLQRRGVCN
jgi:hypothetical protein